MSTALVNVFDSLIQFDNFKPVATGTRSRVLSAESIEFQEQEEGNVHQTVHNVIIKKIDADVLFNSDKLLDANCSEEEKMSSISEQQFSQVKERFIAAAEFFNETPLVHDSLLQITGVIAPRNNLSEFAIISENFEGISLKSLLATPEGRLQLESIPIEFKLQRLFDISSALGQLHDADLLHRNLHDGNILFSSDFKLVKVSDYALDVFLVRVPTESVEGEDEEEEDEGDESKEESQLMNVSELRKVCSPPELLAELGYNEASDIYSFAMIAYQFLTCQSVEFDVEDQTELVKLIVKDGCRPSLEDMENIVPLELRHDIEKLLQDCWHKKPSCRPEAKEVSQRLREVISKL
eukprot:TRINITY_DN11169_c0_g1_i1.p1 TRINITY_DN11169_c0_g1~~TRINITY_DN11169_c0_g1_i1.p1  ORF type:complete len:382 (+),score=115.96 TRINITY_DN11169_c0_g1_i1:96-1148(+)